MAYTITYEDPYTGFDLEEIIRQAIEARRDEARKLRELDNDPAKAVARDLEARADRLQDVFEQLSDIADALACDEDGAAAAEGTC